MIIDLLPYRQNILDFIQLDQLKNGAYRIQFPSFKKNNVYNFLKKLEFAYVKVGKQSMFVQKHHGDIKRVGFIDIENAFRDCLEKSDYSGLPTGITRHDVMNEYFRHSVIKNNSSIKHYLRLELDEDDLHNLRLKIDYDYKRDNDTALLLKAFKSLQFKEVTDTIGTYHNKGEQLFFKAITANKYLVFNYIQNPPYGHQIFDCWLSYFPKEKHIGSKHPVKTEPVIIDFKIERDFHLIELYLN